MKQRSDKLLRNDVKGPAEAKKGVERGITCPFFQPCELHPTQTGGACQRDQGHSFLLSEEGHFFSPKGAVLSSPGGIVPDGIPGEVITHATGLGDRYRMPVVGNLDGDDRAPIVTGETVTIDGVSLPVLKDKDDPLSVQREADLLENFFAPRYFSCRKGHIFSIKKPVCLKAFRIRSVIFQSPKGR